MNNKFKLSNQLLWLVGIAFIIVFTSLGVVLPRVLIPFAETNLYSYLSEPLKLINKNTDQKLLNTEIAYIDITDDNIITSYNIKDIIKYEDINIVISKTNKEYGKFNYKNKVYYYSVIKKDNNIKIALTNDKYIKDTKASILSAIFPVLIITFIIIGIMLVAWSTIIVRKIEKLKDKIDNIDNNKYNHNIKFKIEDEFKSLSSALEDMRLSLKNQEEVRNTMYQNISHDFKTPLAVIKSYVEASEDKIETKTNSLKVIKEQTNILQNKVESLLYLNKLDYLKDKELKIEEINMKKLISNEIDKFKFQRKDIKFIKEFDKKSKYYGTIDAWETIIDNLLSNFMRYAKKEIKITAKNNKIILYNDGNKIDDNLIEAIFNPYRKGVKGSFGLGLSIVKKTLNIMNYDIYIKNEKKGVSFNIYRKTKR